MIERVNEKELGQFLLKILNTMHDGFLLVGPDGRIAMVNDSLCQLLGYGRSELVGKTCKVLKCDACAQSRAEGHHKWCRLFRQQRDSRRRCTFARKDGTMVTVLKNATVLTDDDGRVIGGVETLTDISELTRQEATIQDLKRMLDNDHTFCGMVGTSAAMRRTFDLLGKAAASDAPVIIFGESGTGKELAARAIHELSPRKDAPFVQCNCAALNESLLESELFGHAKGAFTGAYRHRQGRFEAAHTGDIFLDEIGDVPLSIQVKLLRVLETKSFERVGDHAPIDTDVRIITATNRDLEALVADGTFREDLYFRIKVIPVHLPPLRERVEDIPLLVDAFVSAMRQKSGKHISGPTPEAMQLLASYPWPGNVRELKSALEYAFVVADSGSIDVEHLPVNLGGVTQPLRGDAVQGVHSQERDERQALVNALNLAGGNKSAAARALGVSRGTVLNRMRKYGVRMEKNLVE